MLNEEECGSMRTCEAEDTKGVVEGASHAQNAVVPGKSSPPVYQKICADLMVRFLGEDSDSFVCVIAGRCDNVFDALM